MVQPAESLLGEDSTGSYRTRAAVRRPVPLDNLEMFERMGVSFLP